MVQWNLMSIEANKAALAAVAAIHNHTLKWDYDFDKFQIVKGVDQKGLQTSVSGKVLISLDTETSNGYYNDKSDKVVGFTHDKADFCKDANKAGTLYLWQCAVQNYKAYKRGEEAKVYCGRNYSEFRDFLTALTDNIKNTEISTSKASYSLHLYVHNFGFDFQFIRNAIGPELMAMSEEIRYCREHNRFTKLGMFARNERKPMKLTFMYNGVKLTFHDTLVLTVKSLANWCKDSKLKVQKRKEPKDFYNEVRTPITPLKPEEILYSMEDVIPMCEGVGQYWDKYGGPNNVPMTQTGEIRRTCIEHLGWYDENHTIESEWSDRCKNVLRNTSWEDMLDMMDAYAGGWTHANAKYTNKLMFDIMQVDFASSYPAVMCMKKFPIGAFVPTDYSEIEAISKQDWKDREYCYLVEVEFKGVQRNMCNTFWSTSKCSKLENCTADNGKISSCDYMRATMIDLDFERFQRVYDFEEMNVLRCKKAEADYLPKEFIETILQYYVYKTTLKGTGETSKYNESKQWVNSIYGVMVTKIIADIVEFMEDWTKKAATEQDYYDYVERSTKPYKKGAKSSESSKPMFTIYGIGVWVAGWARHNLWVGIENTDNLTVACDTDSIKLIDTPEARKFFEEYNQSVAEQAQYVAKLRGIEYEMYHPKDPDGEEHHLGFFDEEDKAVEFKTLGAKRYVYKYWNKKINNYSIKCTIAGLPKSSAAELIKQVDNFHIGLQWNTTNSGKTTCTYIDDQPSLSWIDRDGREYQSTEQYSICLTPTSFNLTVTDDYQKFFAYIQGDDTSCDGLADIFTTRVDIHDYL